MRTLEYPLPELDCEDCAAELHKRLMKDPGVHNVTVDAQAKTVKVEVDEEAFASKTLQSRVGALLDGEMQAIAHHRPRTGPEEDAGSPTAPTMAGLGTELAKSLPEAGDGGRPTLPTLAVLGSEAAKASHAGHDHGHGEHGHDHDHAGHDHAGHEHGEGGHSHDWESSSKEMRTMAQSNRKRLLVVLGIGSFIMLAEVIGGLMANSLVLLADAAHYATDLLSVLLAFLAITWAMKPADKHRTFGYHRAEVLAAFVQALALWGISIYFLWEAYKRIIDPPEVEGPILLIVGGLTLVANAFLAWTLQRASGHNLNMRAAYLHILSDVLGSAAALGAGLLVYYKGWHIADPVLTLFITVLIMLFTVRLTKQTLHILMEGAPAHADPHDVTKALKEVPGVQDVHDLHVWTLTSGIDSVSAHVVTSAPQSSDRVVHAVQDMLKSRFKIDHVTVQVEDPSCPCTGARHQWHAA